MSVLDVELVRDAIRRAWWDSQPQTDSAHEEGGFVLQDDDGSLSVERWPSGAQNEILVPSHVDGTRHNRAIVATFHTHPNLGSDFQQEPSPTDIRAVQNDPHLSHPEYEGEYVIASGHVYRILRSGEVIVAGDTRSILGIG